MNTEAQTPARCVWHVLVRLVPIMVVMRVSFALMFRNDRLTRNPHLEPAQIATLVAFVPAGLWAVGDGYRLVPTGQVVALWAGVGAAVVLAHQISTAALDLSQGMTLTVVETARWAAAALDIAVLHAVPAAMLVLLGAGLHRLLHTGATRAFTNSAEGGR